MRAAARLALAAFVLHAGVASADPAPAGGLDGTYVTLGPLAAAVRVDGAWTSAAGGELSLVRVVEHAVPSALGICGGGVAYTSREGGRLWLEVETAVAASLPFPIGVAAGATVQFDPVEHPRLGAQATLWFLAGLVPYVRAGTLESSGVFFETGLMLKIPARRFP